MRAARLIRAALCTGPCALVLAGATAALPAAARVPSAPPLAASDRFDAGSGLRTAGRSTARAGTRAGTRSAAQPGARAEDAAAAPDAELYVPTSADKVPTRAQVLVLIRSTLIALDQANSAGYYFVFAGLASEGFRNNNSPSAVGRAFEAYRARGISFSPVLILDPVFTQPPVIEAGELRMAGHFPSQPDQIGFDLRYRYDRGQWRLSGIDMHMLHTPVPGEQAGQAPPTEQPRAPAVSGR